jgi:polar amino acid transport system permease protein
MAGLYIEVTRNVPGLFWIVFFYFVFPELLPEALGKPLAAYPHYAVVASLLALTVDNSPYVAEILRSSIQAVSPGQWEASAAYGFSRRQQFLFIVLPQALRTAAGPLGTRTIHNFKNTSLCMAISTPELTWATQQIESLTFRGIEATLVATGFYVFIGVTLATLVNLAERRHRFRRS